MLKPKIFSLTILFLTMLFPAIVSLCFVRSSVAGIQVNGMPKGFNKLIPAPQSPATPRPQPNGSPGGHNPGGHNHGGPNHSHGGYYPGGYPGSQSGYYQGGGYSGYSGYAGNFGPGYAGYHQAYRVPLTSGVPYYNGPYGNLNPYGSYGYQTELFVYPGANIMANDGMGGHNVNSGYGIGYGLEAQPEFDQPTLGGPSVRQPVPPPDLNFPIILTKTVARSAQQRAERAFRNGQYKEAAQLANQVIVLDSENGLAWLFASHTKFASGDFTKAAEDLRVAMSLLPEKDWAEIVRNFRSFYGQNDYVKQMDRLNQSIENEPQILATKFVRGHQWASLGYPQQAYGDLLFVQRARPHDEAYRSLLRQVEGQINAQSVNQQTSNGNERPITPNFTVPTDPVPHQHGMVPSNQALDTVMPQEPNPQPATGNDPFGFDQEDQTETFELLPPGDVVEDIQLPRR